MREKETEKSMQRQVARLGNSLAITIPAEFATELNLQKGDTVTVSMNPDKTLKLDANSVIPHHEIDHLIDQAMV